MLMVVEVVFCDIGILGGYTDHLVMLKEISGRFGTTHAHIALPEAEIKLTAEGPESGAFDITLPQK